MSNALARDGSTALGHVRSAAPISRWLPVRKPAAWMP
jgi:hypothetical protein